MASAIKELLNILNDLSKKDGQATILQKTVIRFDGRRWWFMNRPDNGWNENGRCYRSLSDIARIYSLKFLSIAHDEHSLIVNVEPLEQIS